jgi:hypothetical protein
LIDEELALLFDLVMASLVWKLCSKSPPKAWLKGSVTGASEGALTEGVVAEKDGTSRVGFKLW